MAPNANFIRNLTCLLLLSFLPRFIYAGYSDFVHFENDLGDLVKPKQPILGARDGRFIRFDTKDSEIELELGVAVPFLKIPTLLGSKADNHITINIAGLLVGATILLTSFLLIPLVLPNQYGHSRSDQENQAPNGAWHIVQEAEDLMKKYNLDVRECSKKLVCEYTKTAANAAGDMIFNAAIGMSPVKNILERIYLTDAVTVGRNGDCSLAYPSCALQLSLLPTLFSQ